MALPRISRLYDNAIAPRFNAKDVIRSTDKTQDDNENPANYYSEQKFWASILWRIWGLTTALESGLTTWPVGNAPRHSIEMPFSKDFLMTNFALALLKGGTRSNPLPSITPHTSTAHPLHIIRTRLYTTMIKPAFWTAFRESFSRYFYDRFLWRCWNTYPMADSFDLGISEGGFFLQIHLRSEQLVQGHCTVTSW